MAKKNTNRPQGVPKNNHGATPKVKSQMPSMRKPPPPPKPKPKK